MVKKYTIRKYSLMYWLEASIPALMMMGVLIYGVYCTLGSPW